MGRNIYARKSVIGQYSHNVQHSRTSELWQVCTYSYSKVHICMYRSLWKTSSSFPRFFVWQLSILGQKYLLQNAVEGPLKHLQLCIIYLISSWAKSLSFFQACGCYCFQKETFPENWDSKAPSIGTLLAYVETRT